MEVISILASRQAVRPRRCHLNSYYSPTEAHSAGILTIHVKLVQQSPHVRQMHHVRVDDAEKSCHSQASRYTLVSPEPSSCSAIRSRSKLATGSATCRSCQYGMGTRTLWTKTYGSYSPQGNMMLVGLMCQPQYLFGSVTFGLGDRPTGNVSLQPDRNSWRFSNRD